MAWYRSGTVTVTNGSGTVTGSGTAFVANASLGEGFLGPDGRTYEITDIASNTSITISPNYLGSTASGQTYAIAPLRGRIADLIAETSSLLSSFSTVRDGIGAGLFPDGSTAAPAMRFSSDQDTGIRRSGTNSLAIVTNATDRMVFDGSGNIGIGINAPLAKIHTHIPGTDKPVHFLSNATLGSGFGGFFSGYGVTGGGGFAALGTVQDGTFTEAVVIDQENNFWPAVDGTQTLGLAGKRWDVVYSETGTINTSDAREKTWRGALTADELRAAKRIIAELGIYQWNDAIALKGATVARLHIGVRAQEAFDIMEDEGLDWTRYAWCCHDTWDGGDRYGIRADQFAFWLTAAQADIQADLEARLTALETA